MRTKINPEHLDIVQRVLEFICGRFGVTVAELEGRARPWRIVLPRWLAVEIVARETGLPGTALGILFGKDHSAVYYGRAELASLTQYSPESPVAIQIREALLAWAAAERNLKVAATGAVAEGNDAKDGRS